MPFFTGASGVGNAHFNGSYEEKCQKPSFPLDLSSAPFPVDNQFPSPPAIHRLPLSWHSSRAYPNSRRLLEVLAAASAARAFQAEHCFTHVSSETTWALFMGPIDGVRVLLGGTHRMSDTQNISFSPPWQISDSGKLDQPKATELDALSCRSFCPNLHCRCRGRPGFTNSDEQLDGKVGF